MAKRRTSYIRPLHRACAVLPEVNITLTGGSVTSVNGMIGDVVLEPEDIGAIPAAQIADDADIGQALDDVISGDGTDVDSGGLVATDDEISEMLDDIFGQ